MVARLIVDQLDRGQYPLIPEMKTAIEELKMEMVTIPFDNVVTAMSMNLMKDMPEASMDEIVHVVLESWYHEGIIERREDGMYITPEFLNVEKSALDLTSY